MHYINIKSNFLGPSNKCADLDYDGVTEHDVEYYFWQKRVALFFSTTVWQALKQSLLKITFDTLPQRGSENSLLKGGYLLSHFSRKTLHLFD